MTALLENPAASPAPMADPPARLHRRKRTSTDPRWVRPSYYGMLALTALLYFWDLSISGWANAFYSAAAQAGSQSWKAWFFGSLDAGNAITVDKPPAALWIDGLSARIFGVNSFAVLAPQALMGVLSVALLYKTVRRVSTPAAGLIAGAVLALTPIATLIFRFNNPDALLVLLLIGSVWATVRALEKGSAKLLMLAGAFVGFGFLTKMLQALVVVPIIAAVWMYAAPTPVGKRITALLAGGAAMIVSAGWYIAVVSLWPAADRPYIGGSTNNSILELTLGYNGLGRLTGNETGSAQNGNGSGGNWGATGILRMFNSEFGGQASWLIPAALVAIVAGAVLRWKAPRTDARRASYALWAGWLLVTGVMFSLAQGIIHPYYSVALAPAIGALVGLGAVEVWEKRETILARVFGGVALAVSAWWSYELVARATGWHTWLGPLVVLTAIAAIGLLAYGPQVPKVVGAVTVALALTAILAGPAEASIQTASVSHTGAIPSAGPTGLNGSGTRGGGFGGGGNRGGGGFGGGQRAGGQTGFGGGAPAGTPGGNTTGRTFGGGGGGVGNLLDASTPSAALVTALDANSSSYTWVAAAIGANSAAGLQLGSGKPVIAIGGFNGTDPAPTLAQFEAWVSAGKIHYFVGGGGTGGGGTTTSDAATAITSWVEQNYTATTIGGTTVYDLTTPNG